MANFLQKNGFIALLVLGIAVSCYGGVLNMNKRGLDTVKSDWGYVTVRQDAHMFWWLFFQDPSYKPSFLPVLDPIPVVVWLQGGPGASGVGYGNFEEVGPLDLDLNRRNTSWTGLAHVLFVDNPVGSGYSIPVITCQISQHPLTTGGIAVSTHYEAFGDMQITYFYSQHLLKLIAAPPVGINIPGCETLLYVSNSNAYTTNIDQIAADMVALMKGFYTKHPELTTNPLIIMCESYGGKMAAATALAISQEVEAGRMDVNLQAVGLGDAWISPMDSVNTWGPYLYQTGLLDDSGLSAVNQMAQRTQNAVDAGDWSRATNLWSLTESVIIGHTDNVDFYNILYPHHASSAFRSSSRDLASLVPESLIQGYSMNVDRYQADPLDVLMNGEVKEYLGIPDSVVWGSQSNSVFNAQSGDFMKPVIDTVDELIKTGLKVVVYNGQLDLIVDTPGQELWVKSMNWERLNTFQNMDWTPEFAYKGQDTGGFSKKLDNFEFWWILKAGHMVPADQGNFTLFMLHDIITT